MCAVALALVAASASAQPEDAAQDVGAEDAAARAEHAFRAGRDHLAKGENAEACARFVESLALFRRASTLLNLAVCREALGELSAALSHWQQGAALLEGSDERLAIAKDHIADLIERVPELSVTLDERLPANAVVEFDGVVVAREALISVRLDPGSHTVVLDAPGHRRASLRVALVEGERQQHHLALGARLTPAYVPPPALPAPFPLPLAPQEGIPVWIWPVGAVGVALGIAAIPFGVDHASTRDKQQALCGGDLDRCAPDPPGSYDPGADNERKFRDAVLAVSFGVGGGALALVAVIGAIVGTRDDGTGDVSRGRVVIRF
jgi:hypothetical protein